jgi:hypothetical protein
MENIMAVDINFDAASLRRALDLARLDFHEEKKEKSLYENLLLVIIDFPGHFALEIILL